MSCPKEQTLERAILTKIILILQFIILMSVPSYAFGKFSCESIFSRTNLEKAESQQQTLTFISEHISESKIDKVITQLLAVYENTIPEKTNQKMTEKQFYEIYTKLKKVAADYEIRMEPKLDITGIYPEGLNLIKIAGFSEPSVTNSQTPVNFAKRHELAHLFHVIAVRAILAENATELSELNRRQITDFVSDLENGKNYLEFEKIVTNMSSVMHVLTPISAGNKRYGLKLKVLLMGLKPIFYSGKVRFSNGWGIIEIYASFISKAPLVLGKSFAGLSARMPFLIFATSYVVNDSFRMWVDQILQILNR